MCTSIIEIARAEGMAKRGLLTRRDYERHLKALEAAGARVAPTPSDMASTLQAMMRA